MVSVFSSGQAFSFFLLRKCLRVTYRWIRGSVCTVVSKNKWSRGRHIQCYEQCLPWEKAQISVGVMFPILLLRANFMLNSLSFDSFLCKKEKVSNSSIPGEKSSFLLSLIKTYWVQLWSVLSYFGSTLFFLYSVEGEKISSFPSQLPSNCIQELNNAWISIGLFK